MLYWSSSARCISVRKCPINSGICFLSLKQDMYMLPVSAYVWIGPYKHSHHYPGYIYFSLLHSEACWWKSWQTLASQCHWVHSTFDLSVVALWKCNTVKEMSLGSNLWIIASMCTCSLSPLTHLLCWQLIASFRQWWKYFRGVLSKAEPPARKSCSVTVPLRTWGVALARWTLYFVALCPLPLVLA